MCYLSPFIWEGKIWTRARAGIEDHQAKGADVGKVQKSILERAWCWVASSQLGEPRMCKVSGDGASGSSVGRHKGLGSHVLNFTTVLGTTDWILFQAERWHGRICLVERSFLTVERKMDQVEIIRDEETQEETVDIKQKRSDQAEPGQSRWGWRGNKGGECCLLAIDEYLFLKDFFWKVQQVWDVWSFWHPNSICYKRRCCSNFYDGLGWKLVKPLQNAQRAANLSEPSAGAEVRQPGCNRVMDFSGWKEIPAMLREQDMGHRQLAVYCFGRTNKLIHRLTTKITILRWGNGLSLYSEYLNFNMDLLWKLIPLHGFPFCKAS